MNYLLKSREEKPKRNIIKTFIILIITLVFFVVFSQDFSKNILFSIGKPLWGFSSSLVSFWDNNIGILRSKQSLIAENIKLEEQIKSSKKDFLFLNLIKKENETLKDLLNRKKIGYSLILASVLEKPGLSPYDTLIVDVGKKDGISKGQLVMADSSVLIGEVAEVYDFSSKIKLYSSPGEKISVLVGSSNILKEAQGVGNGNYKIEVPKEIGVEVGDSIVIPSINVNIFGIVEKIESKNTDSFEVVLFKSPINIQELKFVEIVKK
ncbi:MAG: rod shape-determining protein MreC [Minisyncoccia bacterium]